MASKYTIKCQEYINYTQVKSGSYAASVSSTVRSDAYNESASRVYAQAKYNNYSVNLSSTGATNKGGSESSTDLARVGSTYSRSKSTPSYTYQYSYDGIDYYTTCTASFTASATRRSYCTYLKFTRPTNINANDIASATLKFTPADASSSDTEYILAALNNTSSMYIDDFSNLNSQQITIHGTGEKTIDITNLFKQWMNLGGTTGYFYFGSDVTTWRSFQFPDSATNVIIEYTVAYTNVTTDSRGATVSPSGIQKPGTPYTVSWYAGAAGEGNPIKGYKVEYKDDDGSFITLYSNLNALSFSSTVLESSPKRGSKRTWRITALGTQSGYNGKSVTSSSYIQTNRLPSEPSVYPNNAVQVNNVWKIKSTSTSFTCNGQIGNDLDGQTCTLVYNTLNDPTGATQLTLNSTQITIGSSEQTYYFWTKDSLGEFSTNYVSFNIKINDSALSSDGITVEKVLFNAVNTYPNRFNLYVNNISGGTSKYTYKWEIFYNQQYYNIGESASILDYDVTSIINNFGDSFSFRVTIKDSIEDDLIHTSQSYSLPTIPYITSYTNGISSQVTGTTANHFYNTIHFYRNAHNNDYGAIIKLVYKYNDSDYIEIGTEWGLDTDYILNFLNAEHGIEYTFFLKVTLGNITSYSNQDGVIKLLRSYDFSNYLNSIALSSISPKFYKDDNTITPYITASCSDLPNNISIDDYNSTTAQQLDLPQSLKDAIQIEISGDKNKTYVFQSSQKAFSQVNDNGQIQISIWDNEQTSLTYMPSGLPIVNWADYFSQANPGNSYGNGIIKFSIETLFGEKFIKEINIKPDFSSKIFYDNFQIKIQKYTYTIWALSSENNPKALNLYELQNGKYILTQDTSVVSGKNYYVQGTQYVALSDANFPQSFLEGENYIFSIKISSWQDQQIIASIVKNNNIYKNLSDTIQFKKDNGYLYCEKTIDLNYNVQKIAVDILENFNLQYRINCQSYINSILVSKTYSFKEIRNNIDASDLNIYNIVYQNGTINGYIYCTDFGGSGNTPKIDNYIKNESLFYLQFSKDANFTNELDVITLPANSNSNQINLNAFISDNNILFENNNLADNLNDFDFLYVRIKVILKNILSIGSTSDDTIVGVKEYVCFSNVALIYNKAPTIYYGKNRLAINAAQFYNEEAVLSLYAFQQKNKVYLISLNPDEDRDNSFISINIDSGEIDGTIIDCGTWEPYENYKVKNDDNTTWDDYNVKTADNSSNEEFMVSKG